MRPYTIIIIVVFATEYIAAIISLSKVITITHKEFIKIAFYWASTAG